MTPDRMDEALFAAANLVVLGPWLLLLLAPRAQVTRRLVHSPVPALVLVPLYVACIFFDPRGPEGGSFWSVAGVQAIFASPRTAVGCWIHYLIFDLFVGAWIARDARRLALPHLVAVPCLLVTLLSARSGTPPGSSSAPSCAVASGSTKPRAPPRLRRRAPLLSRGSRSRAVDLP